MRSSSKTQFTDITSLRPTESIQDATAVRKRLFIGLLTGTSFLVVLFLGLFWLIPYIGLTTIHPAAPWVLGGLVVLAALLVIWSSLALVLNILFKRPVLFSRRIRGIAVTCYLPLMIGVGRLMGLSKERIRASFVQVNNDIVQAERSTFFPEEILLLMPHCLQNSLCKYRLTYNINNCRRCGECQIADLLSFSESFGVKLAIATGGTIARRIVVQNRPRLIIAVACERDLSSGIQDTYPLPVYGILNERPHGPCLDTRVPLPQLELAIRSFLRSEDDGNSEAERTKREPEHEEPSPQ
ncbi:MAG: DUF116 domain-containing protein [Desulfohalobiaceae bacterium]